MQFLILLEFEKNRKNSRLNEALDSKVGKKFTIKRDKEKAIIAEELFDVLQAEIEIKKEKRLSSSEMQNFGLKITIKFLEH